MRIMGKFGVTRWSKVRQIRAYKKHEGERNLEGSNNHIDERTVNYIITSNGDTCTPATHPPSTQGDRTKRGGGGTESARTGVHRRAQSEHPGDPSIPRRSGAPCRASLPFGLQCGDDPARTPGPGCWKGEIAYIYISSTESSQAAQKKADEDGGGEPKYIYVSRTGSASQETPPPETPSQDPSQSPSQPPNRLRGRVLRGLTGRLARGRRLLCDPLLTAYIDVCHWLSSTVMGIRLGALRT
ncbi:unnamed protein product [Trypanosoma congolense IL3000]|uniref:WGS project CAEQ00000000 data, annotated contig 1389 n=1 Tax=Trypanosoma congolense (strain IL3000) TaxID=1068625 RepID=F9W5W1_TRYCI|nr:unnamed protein product [Trypanosoma congolense IL3000]